MRIDEILSFKRKKKDAEPAKKGGARAAIHKANDDAHNALRDEVSKGAKEAGVKGKPDGDAELAKHRATHGKPKSRKDYDDEHDRLMSDIKKTVGEMGEIGKKDSPAKKTGPNSRPESRVTK